MANAERARERLFHFLSELAPAAAGLGLDRAPPGLVEPAPGVPFIAERGVSFPSGVPLKVGAAGDCCCCCWDLSRGSSLRAAAATCEFTAAEVVTVAVVAYG